MRFGNIQNVQKRHKINPRKIRFHNSNPSNSDRKNMVFIDSSKMSSTRQLIFGKRKRILKIMKSVSLLRNIQKNIVTYFCLVISYRFAFCLAYIAHKLLIKLTFCTERSSLCTPAIDNQNFVFIFRKHFGSDFEPLDSEYE